MPLFTSTQPGNWSNTATWGGSGPPKDGDAASIKHAVIQDINVNIGQALQGQTLTAPTYSANTGSGATNLATATYLGMFTTVNASGETGPGFGAGLTERSCAIVNGQQPVITFPSLPPTNCSYNFYLTNSGGLTGTEGLYCSGITGLTLNLISSGWLNNYSSISGIAIGGSISYGSAFISNPVPTFASKSAILIGTNATASLSINSGLKLNVFGDINFGGGGNTIALYMSSGVSLNFNPTLATDPTKAKYQIYSQGGMIVCSGDNNLRSTIKTIFVSGNEATTITSVGSTTNRFGWSTVLNTDIVNMGDTTNYGIQFIDNVAASSVSMTYTNCNLINSNLQANSNKNSWNGNILLQYCLFSGSKSISVGGHPTCCNLGFNSTPSGISTRLIDSNCFDLGLAGNFINNTISNNIFYQPIQFITSYHLTDNFFKNNIATWNTNTYGSAWSIFGPWKNCYFYNTDTGAADLHTTQIGINVNVTGYSVTNCLYEGFASNANGDFIIGNNSFPNNSIIKIIGNIMLPSASGKLSSGTLGPTDISVSGISVIVEHNTHFGINKVGITYFGETTSAAPSSITSWRSNLIVNYGNATSCYALAQLTHSGINIVSVPDSITSFGAGYNGFYNPTSGICICNGVTLNTIGYNLFAVTSSGFPNSQIGSGDIYGYTSIFDPLFLDKTRSLGKWGQTFQNIAANTDNGTSGTFAWLSSNLQSLSTNISTLMSWVREGYHITNPIYQSGYPGDILSADANGNSYLGGLPTIGAMSYMQSSTSGATVNYTFTINTLNPFSPRDSTIINIINKSPHIITITTR